MTTVHDTPAAPIASRARLVAVVVVALVSSYFLAWGLANVRGWDSRVEKLGIDASAGLGVLAALVGIIAGLAVVWSPGARTTRSLGLRVLAAGSTRMMLALTLGVGFLVTFEPEGYTFFAALTVACLGTLLGEVAWAVSALRRAADSSPPNHPTKLSTGAPAR